MSDQVPYRVKPLIPRTPTEVRDEMVRHRKAFAERAGVEPSSRVIERGVLTDLDLVEAYKRGTLPPPPPAKRPFRRPPEPQPDADLKLVSPASPPRKFERLAPLHAPPIALGLKWAAAVARVGEIMHGMQPAPTIEESLKTATCPELALEWARLYADYRMRYRHTRLNPFTGLSERDASRMLMRRVMDICDRSTGRLGAWF